MSSTIPTRRPRLPRARVILAAVAALAAAQAALALTAADTGAPVLTIAAPAAGTGQRWQSQLRYRASASYRGQSTGFGELPANDVVLEARYLPDLAGAAAAPRQLPAALVTMSQSNCSGCHDFAAAGAGPSYQAIAQRYAHQPGAAAQLAQHIRNGVHGLWGASAMPPHPDLSPGETQALAEWIIGHGADPAVHYAIGSEGVVRMEAPGRPGPRAGLVLTAYYAGPLTGGETTRSAGPRSRVAIAGTPGS